jgi:hypothetical protein
MTPLMGDVVRREVNRLFADRYRGHCLCMSCLVAFVHALLWSSYTRSRIRGALHGILKSPGTLRHEPSLVCDQCGKTAACLSAK